MEYIWLGGVANEEEFDEMIKKGNNQAAANVMQLNYIKGIEKNIKDSVKIISSHFQPSYPKYKDWINHRRIWKRNGKENIDISFLNLPLIKHFIKAINIRRELRKIYRKNKQQEVTFFIYSLTTPLAFSVPYIKRKWGKKAKVCYVVPDLPQYMNFGKQNIIKRILKYVDWKFIKKSIKKVDLFVLFAEAMNEYLKLNEERYIVIEGMIDYKESEESIEDKKRENYIMYAGSLNETYGILNLIQAFEEIENDNIQLWLYGTGNAVGKIKEESKRDCRIKYKGLVSHAKVLEDEKKAKFLINPRPVDEEYTKYSFPSKTLEYMMSGTPFLTTKLKGIPDEYDQYLFIIGSTQENLYKDLLKIINLPNEEISRKGKQAKKFVIEQKNNKIQTKKILEKLERII